MDTVEFSKVRFDEVVRKMERFLRHAGFKVSMASFVHRLMGVLSPLQQFC